LSCATATQNKYTEKHIIIKGINIQYKISPIVKVLTGRNPEFCSETILARKTAKAAPVKISHSTISLIVIAFSPLKMDVYPGLGCSRKYLPNIK
jgi:hypothetical protein